MERAQGPSPKDTGEAARQGQDCGRVRGRGSALTLYLDTNALVKLLIDEPGSDIAESAIQDARISIASRLAYVEVHSALTRMAVGRRLTQRAYRVAVELFTDLWDEVGAVEVDGQLIAHAAELARGHRLRAYDAVHLASALSVKREPDFAFACWDQDLRSAAAAEGLELIPADA